MKFSRVILLWLAVVSAGRAQDLRKVKEPSIPRRCAVVRAALTTSGTSLAAADEMKPDTDRIQKAMDRCPAGQAVELTADGARNAFLSGPLTLRAGVALLVDEGAVLYASRNPRDYDREPGVCGTITEKGHGCKALINGDGVAGAAVMGGGIIDGRGGEKIAGQGITWWDLAEQARKGGSQNNPRIAILNRCNDFVFYRISLRNSPNFHVSYSGGVGFTVWGVKIWSPQKARNTDGIDPGNSTNVTIANCFIHTGDDQVAIKAGKGAPTAHMTIEHNHFYTGHGMSIGSETDGGASAIRVRDLTIDGADNGLRIKSNRSRGGLVRDIVYDNVCIRDTKNPIVMDTNYSYSGDAGDKLPEFREIVIGNARVLGAGKVTLEGLDPTHRLGIRFANVAFEDPAHIKVSSRNADVDAGISAIDLRGPGVNLVQQRGDAAAISCAGRFVPWPER